MVSFPSPCFRKTGLLEQPLKRTAFSGKPFHELHRFPANLGIIEPPEFAVFARMMLRAIRDDETTRHQLTQHRSQGSRPKPMITASTLPHAVSAIKEDTKGGNGFFKRALPETSPPMHFDGLASKPMTIHLG
jgi:hypothetical protein